MKAMVRAIWFPTCFALLCWSALALAGHFTGATLGGRFSLHGVVAIAASLAGWRAAKLVGTRAAGALAGGGLVLALTLLSFLLWLVSSVGLPSGVDLPPLPPAAGVLYGLVVMVILSVIMGWCGASLAVKRGQASAS